MWFLCIFNKHLRDFEMNKIKLIDFDFFSTLFVVINNEGAKIFLQFIY